MRTRPGQRLALLLSHGALTLAGALAALRCGLTVVTLNPGEPPARLREMREATDPHLLLSDRVHAELARTAGFATADTVLLASLTRRRRRPLPEIAPDPDAIAFLVCTSGSPGRPKVVMQSHRNLLHNVPRYTNGLGIEPEDRIAWLASLSGGQGWPPPSPRCSTARRCAPS
jgi:acyl-CoA synthetase (AMP-forming)/AMP-acid ligase II